MARTKKWLDADERRAWIGLIATMSLLDDALDDQLQRDSGISHGQYTILSRLSEAEGRTLHMSELALVTHSSQSRLSRAVARVEELGWVTRSRCPVNRRAVHASLTDAGFALVSAAAPGHVREVRRLLFDRLDPQLLAQLNAFVAAALGGLSAAGAPVPPLPVGDHPGGRAPRAGRGPDRERADGPRGSAR